MTVLLGWLGLVALASSAGAETEADENANIDLVNAFIAAWDDPEKAVTYLADEASVRMVEDQPPIVGRAAVLAEFKRFMTPEVTLTVDTYETTSHGPVVLNRRIDVMKTKGKPDQVFPIAGVFVVKNGKIVEWTDYLDR